MRMDWLAKKEYKKDKIEEERSYMVIEDTDESPIVEIGNNYISIEKRDKLKERYKQIKEKMEMGNKN
ncbi:45702_t:CDS:2 [Gigaspora margarita]|uniref:45702_t:CDS:1 n=1 Tax=Gigaspora margarita TaxID=4874 RepID=A0ABN7WA68_GIGMA|nr:45702_t:CDS:2 [Gigaspora margarita]